MIDKLEPFLKRYQEVEMLMGDPEIVKDQKRFRELTSEHSYLLKLAEAHKEYTQTIEDLEAAKEMLKDPEMGEMAKEELAELEPKKEQLEQDIRLLLIPPDPLDQKNIIVEIRAGTGGDEAGLFVADLYRMYSRYGEKVRWKTEIISANETEIGGYKEIVFQVSGDSVYGNLRYESGVHRVQRVPATESGGRIHTSAVTVAVLPEAEETDIDIRTEDLRIDTYRSSGAGGQHVNTTDSAVRITHIPTGVVVECQDERSQIKNRAKAMKVLRSRLLEAEEQKKAAERSEARKGMVGSGDRSERIRTYNYPQNRVTDHRINLTVYKLDAIMTGALEEVIEPLKITVQNENLKSLED